MKPGWKNGTRITFEGKGDEQPGGQAGDVVFVVKEQPHAKFHRQGDELHTTVKVMHIFLPERSHGGIRGPVK